MAAIDRRQSTMSILVQEGERHLPDDFKPCVTDTFREIDTAGVVIVPLRVFEVFPEIVHPKFRSEGDYIFSDGDVNIFMTCPGLIAPTSGEVNELTQAWVLSVSTLTELEEAIHQLSTFPTLISVTLTIRSVLEDSAEVPMVIFLSPESTCIKNLISKLDEIKASFNSGTKFCVEVDLGPSLERWGKMVLRREFLSVGGRFCVTNGTMFNHMFDWNTVFGCIPCLPCGIIGSSAYRIHRKINYQDAMLDGQLDIVIIGSTGMDGSSQQYAAYLLIEWIRVFKLYYCMDCRRRIPTTKDEATNNSFCKCMSNSPSLPRIPKNKVAPLYTPEDETGDVTTENDEKTRRREDRRRRRRMRKKRRRAKARGRTGGKHAGSGEEDSDDLDESSCSEDDGQGKGTRSRRIRSKSQSKMSKHKGPFAPYAAEAGGQSIARRENMLKHDPMLSKPERDAALHVLNSMKQIGSKNPVGPKAVFIYPVNKKKRDVRKHRPSASGFEEIQLKIVGEENTVSETSEKNTADTEVTLSPGETEDGHHEDDLYKDSDNAFYFSATDVDQANPVGRSDMHTLPSHAEVPALDPERTTITEQPTGKK